ncbi:PKD domain-containing protein [Saprospiraceae bacterium]|nr:PKD domain-containing protein [Saprospiraceae bacterium]
MNFNKNFALMAFLFLSLTLITSCDEPVVDPDPSTVLASFTAQVDADNSLTYAFTNGSVVNGIDDNTFTSSWDFGGDGTSTDESPSHTFSAEGTYDVVLTVTASDGVVASATETVEVTAPKNRYAIITDMTDSDTGELRLAVDSIQNGRVTFNYRVAEGPGMDIQDGFINVSGSSTTGDFALLEVRLKDNAPHEFREGASDDAIASSTFPEGAPDVWVPIEISWAADGLSAPLYSLSINGTVIITDGISTTNGGAGDVDGHLAAVIDGAANFQWKYAGNSAVSDGMFHVDDIVIYSSDSGAEAVVFEDNFQGRVAGDNLDSEVNADSPYHPNSADVTVGEDQ